ncbi:Uncharacterized protein SCF082_LOCUS21551, partial [Durusdinium trenchii]
VCSDLVSAWASEAAGITEGCTDAFHRRVPKLDLQSCLQEQIRVFPVPPNGSAYSPQT